MKSVNYFDLGLHTAVEFHWMINQIFKDLGIQDYRAYGFEACKKYSELAAKKFRKNPKVSIINKAICDSNSPVKLYYAKNRVGHSIFESKNNVTSAYEEVEGIIFSDWLEKTVPFFRDALNILRVNIEGAEWHLFHDLANKDLLRYFGFICGTGHDVEKIPELSAAEYYSLIERHQIKIHRFSDWKPERNADIKNLVREFVVQQSL